MIKAIVFDCFGVLTTSGLWKKFTDTLPHDERLLGEVQKISNAHDAGRLSEQDFLTYMRELTGKEPDLVEDLPMNRINKNEELLAYINQLKGQYKIGLLSNIASDWITEHFLNQDEQSLFDVMLLSHKVGYTKPDARIYELMCERLGVAPEEIVMVDDVDRYCAAAEALGMKSVTYTDFTSLKRQLESLLSDTNH